MSGFYRLSEGGRLDHAPNGVATPTGRYVKADHHKYTYPLAGGWQWFDSEADAILHFAAVVGETPPHVSMFQARAALIAAGLFDTVDAAIRDSGDPIAQTAWEYATVIERDSPLMQTLAGKLGLAPGQIDQLFRAASRIKA